MLRDPYYAGYVVYKGEIYPGRHEPIVSQQLFDRVQDILNARSGRGQRDRVLRHYLKGLLYCDRCRQAGRTSRLIYVEASGRGGQTYTYFLCRGRQDGVCDLPYLKVAAVEKAILNHYASLRLPADFVAGVRETLAQIMDEEHETVTTLHKGFRKQLRDLDVREDRLIDLAESGTLPAAKVRARLLKIETDRKAAEQGLAETADQLATGAAILRQYLELLEDPQELYRCASDEARRLLNQAFYTHLYCNDHGRITDQKQPAIEELLGLPERMTFDQSVGSTRRDRATERQNSDSNRDLSTAEVSVNTGTDLLARNDDSHVTVSSKAVLVGRVGLEPTTQGL